MSLRFSGSSDEKSLHASLKRRIAASLPYDPLKPPHPDRVDPFDKKTIVPYTPLKALDRVCLPMALPDLKKISGLTTSSAPITVMVPGQIQKALHSVPEARIAWNNPDVNRVQETDFTYHFNSRWSLTKCVRDLYQNFSDSHGGTLAGVTVSAQREKDGFYRLTVQGQGEYAYEFVKNFISSKGDDDQAAGGFGEGTKIMTLSLLKEHGAESVAFSSRNWVLTYFSEPKTVAGIETRLMYRKLTRVSDRPGNALEIRTKNPELVQSVFQGLRLFYHSANADFAHPTFENAVGGFKVLGMNPEGRPVKGNIYSARQRFEYETAGLWDDSIDFVTFWTNKNVLKLQDEVDRDRLPLSTDKVKLMANALAESMTNEELIGAIFALQPVWANDDVLKAYGMDPEKTPYTERSRVLNDSPARILLFALLREAADYKYDDNFKSLRRIAAQFPEKYVVDSSEASKGVKDRLKEEGYRLCPYAFSNVGMLKDAQKWQEISAFNPVMPSKNEVRRLNILKASALLLVQHLSLLKGKARINAADVEKPVYLFDRQAREETKNTLGSYARTHIWIDRSYLATESLPKVLATYVHELLHRWASDEDPQFGYSLTDVMGGLLDMVINLPPEKQREFQWLQEQWNRALSTGQPSLSVVA